MTEPNVLGNVSPAKFLFDSGNTQIINLWKPDISSATQSAHYPDAATVNGQNYQIPVSRKFYLMSMTFPLIGTATHPYIQKNTTPDTATGGTTLVRFQFNSAVDNERNLQQPFPCFAEFAAGEYVTIYDNQGNTYWWTAWGVECDA